MGKSKKRKLKKKVTKFKRIRHGMGKAARRLRGIIRKCNNCGKRGQELFKVYSFKKSGVTKKQYLCKKCYSKIFVRKEEEF